MVAHNFDEGPRQATEGESPVCSPPDSLESTEPVEEGPFDGHTLLPQGQVEKVGSIARFVGSVDTLMDAYSHPRRGTFFFDRLIGTELGEFSDATRYEDIVKRSGAGPKATVRHLGFLEIVDSTTTVLLAFSIPLLIKSPHNTVNESIFFTGVLLALCFKLGVDAVTARCRRFQINAAIEGKRRSQVLKPNKDSND